MSLCIAIRTSNGGVLMAADTAVSASVNGVRYRVADMSDEEKIIILNDGTMVFCSGHIEKCRELRNVMRAMPVLDLDAVQKHAKRLFDRNDDSTGVLAAFPDGRFVGMLSAQNFKMTTLPLDEDGDYFALGFRQDEAYEAINAVFAKDEWDDKTPQVLQLIGRVFLTTHCEEVGRNVHVYSRPYPDGPIQHCVIEIAERENIRKITASQAKLMWAHGIIKAKDFILKDGRSILTEGGRKISGDYIDARGLNIVDNHGNTILSVDGSGMHWSPDSSPVKYQFSTSSSGPWHSAMRSDDKYRRDSLDGGTTWGTSYQFRGTDGQDGSDADVPSYITETKITQTEIESPTIRGGEIHGGKIYGGEFITSGNGVVLNILDGRSMAPQGQITYSASGGLVIGSIGGVVLDHGERYPRMVDEYGESEIVSKNWLKNNPPVAVFG